MSTSFRTNLGIPSYGCCIQNEAGEFVGALSGWFHPVLAIHECEAVILLSATQWAHNLGLQYVLFESNSNP